MAKRKHRRLVATAVQSGGMGVLLIVAPWFVTAPVLVPVVKALAPMGWILLAVAGVFWGLARATSGSAGRQRSAKPDAVVEPRNVRVYTPRFTASSAPNAAVPVPVAVATPRTLPPPKTCDLEPRRLRANRMATLRGRG